MSHGDFVYFFFRETAVEYINCGKVSILILFPYQLSWKKSWMKMHGNWPFFVFFTRWTHLRPLKKKKKNRNHIVRGVLGEELQSWRGRFFGKTLQNKEVRFWSQNSILKIFAFNFKTACILKSSVLPSRGKTPYERLQNTNFLGNLWLIFEIAVRSFSQFAKILKAHLRNFSKWIFYQKKSGNIPTPPWRFSVARQCEGLLFRNRSAKSLSWVRDANPPPQAKK